MKGRETWGTLQEKKGRRDERAAIVAWLQAEGERACLHLRTTSTSNPPTEHMYCGGYAERGLTCPDCPKHDAEEWADAIERGEHVK